MSQKKLKKDRKDIDWCNGQRYGCREGKPIRWNRAKENREKICGWRKKGS